MSVCEKALDFRDGDFKQPSKMMFFYRIHLLQGVIFRCEMFVSGRVHEVLVRGPGTPSDRRRQDGWCHGCGESAVPGQMLHLNKK